MPAAPGGPSPSAQLHLASAGTGGQVRSGNPALSPQTQPWSRTDLRGPSGPGQSGGGGAWLCLGSFGVKRCGGRPHSSQPALLFLPRASPVRGWGDVAWRLLQLGGCCGQGWGCRGWSEKPSTPRSVEGVRAEAEPASCGAGRDVGPGLRGGPGALPSWEILPRGPCNCPHFSCITVCLARSLPCRGSPAPSQQP